jgi:hypothetical protein
MEYLRAHESIDPLTSWNELGIYRLSAVIYDLKKDGHKIETRRKAVTNRFGEVCVVALYVLVDE